MDSRTISMFAVPLVEKVSRCHATVRFYIFGSAVAGAKRTIDDIDILVVYDQIGDVAAVKESLSDLELRVPLDVIYMSGTEEQELNFIESSNAIRITGQEKVSSRLCRKVCIGKRIMML